MMQLKASQLLVTLSAARRANLPLMVWGTPGIGKSEVTCQFSAMEQLQLIDIRLSQYDSVDLRGIPSAKEGFTVWNAPATLPFKGNPAFDPDGAYLLFLDELLQAIPAVQAVAFQLVLDRRIGEHVLMDNVFVVGASNREGDRAGAHRMLTALSNRFVHVEMTHNMDDWCDWAWGQDFDPMVVAFVRQRPDLLSTFLDPKTGNVTNEKVFATPRSWSYVNKIRKLGLPFDVEVSMCAGAVGEGPAAELKAYADTWASMPNIDNILLNPEKAPLPEEPGVKYAVSAALAARSDKSNFGNVYKYVNRMEPEYAVRTIKDACRRNGDLSNTQAFVNAIKTYAKFWKA